MNKWTIVALVGALPLVYLLGRQQGQHLPKPAMAPSATKGLDKTEPEVNSQDLAQRDRQRKEQWLNSPHVSKATYAIGQLERFQKLKPRSKKQAVDPNSPEGKARRDEWQRKKQDLAKRQLQRLKHDPQLLQTWTQRLEHAWASKAGDSNEVSLQKRSLEKLLQHFQEVGTQKPDSKGMHLQEKPLQAKLTQETTSEILALRHYMTLAEVLQ